MSGQGELMKSCPCCGSEPDGVVVSTGYGHGESYDSVGVRCACGLSLLIGGYSRHESDKRMKQAIKKWNTRTETKP